MSIKTYDLRFLEQTINAAPAVRELIACRSCKDSGIVSRLGWDGTPDEDWCDCPAGDAYKAEVENRPPATTF